MQTKYYLLLLSFVILLFLGCNKDNNDNPLEDAETEIVLDKEAVELKSEEKVTITITKGNGEYSANSLDEEVAVAKLMHNQLEIEGKKIGNTFIIIADKKTNLKLLPVTVYRFNEIKLESTSIDIKFKPGITGPTIVRVLEGNGKYVVESGDEKVVLATVTDSTIVVTPRGLGGKTEIVITDASNRKATITVNATPILNPYTEEQLETIKLQTDTPSFIFGGRPGEKHWPTINTVEDGMNLCGFDYYGFYTLKIWFPGDKSVGEYKGGKLLYANVPYYGLSSDGSIDLDYFEIIKNDGEKIWAVYSFIENNNLQGGYFIVDI